MPTIPPFVQQIIGALVRTAIVWIAAQFGAEISEDRAVQLTAQVMPVLLMIGWSIYAKYKGRQKLLTAAASPKPLTEKQIEVRVDAGEAPSVMTVPTTVPTPTMVLP